MKRLEKLPAKLTGMSVTRNAYGTVKVVRGVEYVFSQGVGCDGCAAQVARRLHDDRLLCSQLAECSSGIWKERTPLAAAAYEVVVQADLVVAAWEAGMDFEQFSVLVGKLKSAVKEAKK